MKKELILKQYYKNVPELKILMKKYKPKITVRKKNIQFLWDAKDKKTMYSFCMFRKVGSGFSFRRFPYANVIGIDSNVFKDKKLIGHALFGDYEKRINWVRIAKIMRKEKIIVIYIFKSSKNKYHMISPQVFDIVTALRIGGEIGFEMNYLQLSAVRGEMVLRFSRKGKKGEPKLFKIITNNVRKKVRISRLHYDFLRKFYNVPELKGKFKFAGNRINYERYVTTNVLEEK